ncbi:unnamed protein product [Adineta steineri]|uniref:NAD(P)(+)--arginine ADP-ribosyltransferase n=1 Tax=Adineta steineri TaxID=433720 RepID=A0A819QN06_9BILA|nr:unnamed protein product [Adineta steineri]CAF4037785.1 unnamed protein product [Adineta steineri]
MEKNFTTSSTFNNDDLLVVCLSDYSQNQVNDPFLNLYDDLNNLTNNFKLLYNETEYITYITSIKSEVHVFLIILSPDVFVHPDITGFSQIRFTYVLYINEVDRNHDHIHRYVKEQNIYYNKDLFMRKLKDDMKQVLEDLSTHLTFYNIKERSLKDLSKENQYFMYMHLFHEILLRDSKPNEAKEELIQKCQQSYHNDKNQLKIIEEFRQGDISKEAIKWYTRDSFLYRLLNQALRCQHFEMIYKFRYIIKELYDQLKHLHDGQADILMCLGKAYRGQLLHRNELEHLKQNEEILISMNSFLSTTIEREVALEFILGANENELVPVLFEIDMTDVEYKSAPYAHIQKYSYMKNENEVLFSMDCVFRKKSVNICEDVDKKYYVVTLIATNQYENDNELKELMNFMSYELQCCRNDFSALGFLMEKMGHYEQAKFFYRLNKNNSSNDQTTFAALSVEFASIEDAQGNYAEALDSLNKALEIQLEVLPRDHRKITTIYGNIGSVYQHQGVYDNALNCYKQALTTSLQILPKNHPLVAKICCNIVTVYCEQGEYAEALGYCDKTIGFLNYLPDDHPDIAGISNNIAVIYFHQGKYPEALKYFKEALRIQQKTLPANHSNIASSYNNIAQVYESQGDNDLGLKYLKKSLEIRKESLGENHRDTATVYNNIGMVLLRQNDYTQASIFLNKALDIQLKTLFENHPEVAITYNNIGQIYQKQKNFEQALKLYQKALNIFSTSSLKNHRNMAAVCTSMGLLYQKQNKLDEAMESHQKALTIMLKSLSENHPDVAVVQNNIALVHYDRKEYSEALACFNKVLRIQLESSFTNYLAIATTHSNMAIIYGTQKNISEVCKSCDNTLISVLQSSHEIHPCIVKIYKNLAVAYYTQGEYDLALYYYKNALAIQLQCLPRNDFGVAEIYMSMADVYYSQENRLEGYKFYKKGCEIKLNLLLENLPDLSTTHDSIEKAHQHQQHYTDALDLCENILKIQLNFLLTDPRVGNIQYI